MHVLVTGGAGFVGSHVVDHLVRHGHRVTVWDDFSTGTMRNVQPGVDVEHMTIAKGLIRNQLEPDAVIHCAAKADISGNWESDVGRWELYDTNVKGTINVLEWSSKLHDLKSFTLLSTGAVYGGGDAHRALRPVSKSPYAASKIAGEALLEAYVERYGWSGNIYRLASCVGDRYRHGHIADFVRMWREDGMIRLRDNGLQRKSFVHVLDAAEQIVGGVARAPDGTVLTFDVTSPDLWGVFDTMRVMGLDPNVFAIIPSNESGWIGDPVNLHMRSSFTARHRSVELGVADALLWLGWKGVETLREVAS